MFYEIDPALLVTLQRNPNEEALDSIANYYRSQADSADFWKHNSEPVVSHSRTFQGCEFIVSPPFIDGHLHGKAAGSQAGLSAQINFEIPRVDYNRLQEVSEYLAARLGDQWKSTSARKGFLQGFVGDDESLASVVTATSKPRLKVRTGLYDGSRAIRLDKGIDAFIEDCTPFVKLLNTTLGGLRQVYAPEFKQPSTTIQLRL